MLGAPLDERYVRNPLHLQRALKSRRPVLISITILMIVFICILLSKIDAAGRATDEGYVALPVSPDRREKAVYGPAREDAAGRSGNVDEGDALLSERRREGMDVERF